METEKTKADRRAFLLSAATAIQSAKAFINEALVLGTYSSIDLALDQVEQAKLLLEQSQWEHFVV